MASSVVRSAETVRGCAERLGGQRASATEALGDDSAGLPQELERCLSNFLGGVRALAVGLDALALNLDAVSSDAWLLEQSVSASYSDVRCVWSVAGGGRGGS